VACSERVEENEKVNRLHKKQVFEIVGESDFLLTTEHSNADWVMLLK
jgi:hypothetical protein